MKGFDKEMQQNYDPENVRKLLEQHWIHCRHLESERTWFLLAYIGSIASIVGLIYFRTELKWLIVIPILLTLLGFLLTKRWSDAFEKHRSSVNALISMLQLKSDKSESVDLTMDVPASPLFKLFRTRRLFYLFYLLMLIALIFLPFVS